MKQHQSSDLQSSDFETNFGASRGDQPNDGQPAPDRPIAPSHQHPFFAWRVSPWLTSALVVSTVLAGGLVWVASPPACACGSPLQPTVGSVVRAQQAFYQEHGRFARDGAELQAWVGALVSPNLNQQYRIYTSGNIDTAWVIGEHRSPPELTPLRWTQVLVNKPFARNLPSDYQIQLKADTQGRSSQAIRVSHCEIQRQWVGHPPLKPLTLMEMPPRCQVR